MGRKALVFLVLAVVMPLSGYTLVRQMPSPAVPVAVAQAAGTGWSARDLNGPSVSDAALVDDRTSLRPNGTANPVQGPATSHSGGVRLILIGLALMGLIALRGGRSTLG